MKATQTTNTNTARITLEQVKRYNAMHRTATASVAPLTASNTNTATDTKQATRDRLQELTEKRNALLTALEKSQTVRTDFEKTVHELCETIAQIAVFKTLFKLSDGAKDITQTGAEKCLQMWRDFNEDLRIYRTNDTSEKVRYSDAFDLFNLAYIEIWQFLRESAPLDLTDTVYTKTLKNGNEKNYTLFQYACKGIREYIHSWSKSDNYKRIQYVIGITESGQTVTANKRPTDDLTDIDENTRRAFLSRHGLTAKEQEIMLLVINGESAESIAELLNIPLRTVQHNAKKARAKFATASAYAEYVTARNAEKTAKAKAEKHENDRIYQDLYQRAKDRTEKARAEWQKAFHAKNQ